MRNLITKINQWESEGNKVALATVTKTWGSAPRKVGSHMVINENSEIAGSVSGGCVESSVISSALGVIKSGEQQYLSYGVSDTDAWEVGLACGGEIEIFVFRLNRTNIESINEMISIGYMGSSVYDIYNNDTNSIFSLIDENIDNPVLINDGDNLQFQNHYPPPLHLIIIGGSEIGLELSKLALLQAFKISIIDPRKIFTNKNRFDEQIDLYADWPNKVLGREIILDRSSVVVSLSHDPKIDDFAIMAAIENKIRYVGALGSKKTHLKRISRLKEYGIIDEDIQKIHAPIGLKINAKTPSQIAIAIMAEIIQMFNS